MEANKNDKKVQLGSVLQRIFAMAKPQTTLYALADNPPAIYIERDGKKYKSALNGQTWFVFGNIIVPAPGCPDPGKLMWANFMYWAFKNRSKIFAGALTCLALVSAQCLLWWAPDSQMGEMAMSFIATVNVVMNCLLVFLFGAVVFAVVAYNFGKGVQISYPTTDTAALTAGTISISPDILLCSLSAGESPAEFADRLSDAENEQRAGTWLVIIPFRHPTGIIRTAPPCEESEFEGFVFNRDNPDYQAIDWPLESRIVRPGTRFENETWSEYQNYLSVFCSNFTEWAKMKKATMGNPIEALKGAAKTAVMLLLAMFITVSAFAQKSVRVAEYLGARYELDHPSGDVRFIFQKAEIRRNGDGRKNYKSLLPDGLFYRDADDAGKLVGITVNKSLIMPTPKEGAKTETKIAEATGEVQPVTQDMFEHSSLPDSIRMQEAMNQLQHKIPIYTGIFWTYAKPVVGFLMWLLWFLLPISFPIIGLLNLVGRSARENGNLGEGVSRFQIVCAKYAWFLSMTQVAVIYLASVLTMFFNEMHPVAIGVMSFIGYLVGKWLVNRLTPNGQFQGQTRVTTVNQQRLNG